MKAAPEVIAATSTSIALFGQMSREIGAESMMFAILAAGRQLAPEAARAIWVHPRFSELEEIRKPDYRPCPAKCRACSRCVASESYWSRGGRPYLGVEAEARLAARSAS